MQKPRLWRGFDYWFKLLWAVRYIRHYSDKFSNLFIANCPDAISESAISAIGEGKGISFPAIPAAISLSISLITAFRVVGEVNTSIPVLRVGF